MATFSHKTKNSATLHFKHGSTKAPAAKFDKARFDKSKFEQKNTEDLTTWTFKTKN